MSLLTWIKELLKKEQLNITYPNEHNCAFCWIGLSVLTNFNCKYCKYSFCDEHRIPENHKCLGNPRTPEGFVKGTAESLRHI